MTNLGYLSVSRTFLLAEPFWFLKITTDYSLIKEISVFQNSDYGNLSADTLEIGL